MGCSNNNFKCLNLFWLKRALLSTSRFERMKMIPKKKTQSSLLAHKVRQLGCSRNTKTKIFHRDPKNICG